MNGNDFKICKLKSWGTYRMISLREVKNSCYRFNPSSEFKHLLGSKWDIAFRGELDIGFIDIEKFHKTSAGDRMMKEQTTEYSDDSQQTGDIRLRLNLHNKIVNHLFIKILGHFIKEVLFQ